MSNNLSDVTRSLDLHVLLYYEEQEMKIPLKLAFKAFQMVEGAMPGLLLIARKSFIWD